jgi:hypothetical protein
MIANLADAVALVVFGNAFLGGKSLKHLAIDKFSMFRGAQRFYFWQADIKSKSAKFIAKSPEKYLSSLKRRKIEGLRLTYAVNPSLPGKDQERATAGFENGGAQYLLLEVGQKVVGYVSHSSKMIDGNEAGSHIRQNNYTICPALPLSKHPLSKVDVAAATTKLEGALQKLIEFCAGDELLAGSNWQSIFDKAKKTLTSINAPHHEINPLVPSEFMSPPAMRLLSAASTAWVFGGMGSWNDVRLGDHSKYPEYEKLSDRLYVAVNFAVIEAANSTFTPRRSIWAKLSSAIRDRFFPQVSTSH